MIKLYNFNKCETTNKGYRGHSGSKKGIVFQGENYLLKYPKFRKSWNVEGLTPISEYLGSHIYEIIGIDTHKTILGLCDGKIVVACKDFLNSTEEIIDFNAIKNSYDKDLEQYLEARNSSLFDQHDNLEDILYLMNHNEYFAKVPDLKERFWDMFVIDALINNNDRNEANWGLVLDKENGSLRMAPVYDNGASFYGKSNDDKLSEIIKNEVKLKQVAYDSCISIYTNKEKIMNPLKFMETMQNEECNQAILRIVPKIDLIKIKELIYSIPEKAFELDVMSEIQKAAYYKIIEYRYQEVLNPIYEKLSTKKM